MLGKGPIQGIPPASETNMGKIEIATDAEALAKTATDRALVPSNIDSIITAGGALNNIVEDTTPQLGGDLECSDFNIKEAILKAPAAITSFTGTVSAAVRIVTFSEAADHALCKVGSTIIADGDTRIIVVLSASPNVTVDADTTWGDPTTITSLQDPILQHKDSAGVVDMYVNALGGVGLVGGFGVQRGLVFGDGDSGFYEGSDNTIYVSIAGSDKFVFSPGYFGFYSGILKEVATTTNPNVVAAVSDLDTGLGHAADDQLSLIAGGVEGIRLSETASKMAEKFGCKYYKDYKKMFEKENIDAVSIAVPTSLHKEVAIDCIDQKKTCFN